MAVKMTGTYRGITYNRDKLGLWQSPITHLQARNLIDLADTLRKIPPPKFDMVDYGAIQDSSQLDEVFQEYHTWQPSLFRYLGQNLELANECGTSCCAVGTGAFYGIGGVKKHESWVQYVKRAFGLEGESFKWCFAGDWATKDNEADGAAARILYMLVHGLDFIADLHGDVNDEDDIYTDESVDRYTGMMLTTILPKNPVPGYNQEQP